MGYSMFLYIDPATGGMLFTIMFGLISTIFYFARSIIIKVKYTIGKGRVNNKKNNKLPIVIFSDNMRYWNVFEPICDELEKRGQETYFYTMSENDPALKKDYSYINCEFIGTGNRAFSKMNLLNAYVVVSTTPHLDVFQWKRSKDVNYYIHIQHAANDISMYRMFGTDYYDAILLSGDYQIEQVRELERLRGLPAKDLEMVGIPYMDELKKRLGNGDRVINSERTVLLAPSWGANGILSKYGSKLIDSLINTGYDIIIRPHPQSFVSEKDMITKLMNIYQDVPRLEWNRDNDNFDILKKADILISDFSGIIFDFSLVYDKPIIYADVSYDKSFYDCAWIDEELWTFQILQYIGKKLDSNNFDNLKSIIDECINSEKYKEGREKARKEAWANIGAGASIACDFIINKYNQINHNIGR